MAFAVPAGAGVGTVPPPSISPNCARLLLFSDAGWFICAACVDAEVAPPCATTGGGA